MNIILLTHKREQYKKTNTGPLVLDVLGKSAHIVVWDRVTPDPWLLKIINEGSIALVYPSVDGQFISGASDFQNYIIIDGTWQEAQKIYNRSPYLKSLPAVKLSSNRPSIYHLRRNQREGGLCTAESAIEILNAGDFSMLANDLESSLLRHLASLKK
ncbi:MAG: DTW domain-containing protein YfiP [Gammaproteobacteria bacterium]|jgi:DTW domain-containing protein YfiP